MDYTVIYGHNEKVYKKVGDIVSTNDIIAKMGNTGLSSGSHIHIAVAEGIITDLNLMRLNKLNSGITKPNKEQCEYFAMNDLADSVRITTPYLDPSYERTYKVKHPAIDLVATPKDYKWNRSFKGRVVAVGTNDKGYGNWIMITYSTKPIETKPTYEQLEEEIVKLKERIGNLETNNKRLLNELIVSQDKVNNAINILKN